MNNIKVERIINYPSEYIDRLVEVFYRTNWINKGNRMEQDIAYFKGRIVFISTSKIQIDNGRSMVTVPVGYFLSITQAVPDPNYSQIAYENYELKNKISRLKELLEK